MLRVTSMDADNAHLFSDFLSRQARAMLNTGQPVLMLGLVDDDHACGALTGFMESHSIFRINGIFVAPQVRRRGGASQLLRALSELLAEDEQVTAIRIDYVEFGDEERSLTGFLTAANFQQNTPEMPFFGVTLAELNKSGILTKTNGNHSSIMSFADMPDYLLRSIVYRFSSAGVPIMDVPLISGPVDREISMGIYDGDTVPAFIIIANQHQHLHIALLYAEPSHSTRLPMLLSAAICRANEKYPPETLVTMQTVNPGSEALARRIMENCDFKDLSRSFEFEFRDTYPLLFD